MAFDVQVHEKDLCFSVIAKGDYTFGDFCALAETASREAKTRGHRDVLLDVKEVAGKVPVTEMFELGEYCSKVWRGGLRVVIVSRDGGLDNFFENVAWNRGLQVAVVRDMDRAVASLKGKPSDPKV